ncbi:hypothetical protein HDR58_04250 [bacterium]|nr:hypothetical protein [bacterium]
MKIRHVIPGILIGASSLFTTCTHAPSNANNLANKLSNDSKLNTILVDTFSRKMSDKVKVIEFNKLLKKYQQPVDNYIIVDKKACTATVYSPDGDVLQVSEVALGRNIGDKRSGGYRVKGAELRAYTTPGEFSIVREGLKSKASKDYKLYGSRVLLLAGDHTQKAYQKSQILALHRVPSSPMGKLRENVFNNGTLKDNRVSFGCVNFLVDSYDKMRSFIKGKNTKVYILPEEKGNSLHLEKQKDGTYKFFQTKYRYESQEPKSKPVVPKQTKVQEAPVDTITPDTTKTIEPFKDEKITDIILSDLDDDIIIIPDSI